MRDLLLKRWFLLLLLMGVTLSVVRPDWLRPWISRVPPKAVVAAALFLMAWGLEGRSLLRTLARPLPALWAVVISYGALPAMAWLAGRLLPAPDDLRIGLLISASVPCTLASALLWTRMARGSEATALLVILLTTASSWLVTTAWLTLATGTRTPIDADVLMSSLALWLLAPGGLGQLARASPRLVRTAVRYQRLLGVVSRLLILSVIVQAAVYVRDNLSKYEAALTAGSLLVTAALCVGTHLAALVVGLWSSRGFGFDRSSQIAVAFACSQKTLPVALLLYDYFKKDYPLAVVPMAFYHVGQLVVDTFIADALAERRPLIPQA